VFETADEGSRCDILHCFDGEMRGWNEEMKGYRKGRSGLKGDGRKEKIPRRTDLELVLIS
jgi:hypothetical protein